ncbi:hypothetical protein [uncultured Gelidibacter sp.]|uniref:hypothetical protein n=1 Tax=uncultured Gelidibacter sp. TaxID=259318 RepID=UPI00260AF108|nr:hypothetical protein [uncultured Gelidibacter sp.]
MENQNNNPNKRQRQGNNKRTQLKTIFIYLQNHIATATMVFEATGIPQKCITRYKRDLEKLGLLAEVKRQRCKITNYWAWYITTNPKHFPKSNQLKLF